MRFFETRYKKLDKTPYGMYITKKQPDMKSLFNYMRGFEWT